jgi:tetratricopeptide (TPR) repeat protein
MGSTYRAFISYSHSDASLARWLHRRLEAYRLPAGLGRVSTAGQKSERLGPIFRDREELPAAEDLSASVRAALAASDVLVVLCSPEARASSWVGREIELFRELGPGRPVLAAIARGEPGEAFPEPLLRGREPLAADLRKEGDGRRLGFLKIVAGIASVPLDTLVQRDSQRNLRRVTAITVASVAVALAMAIMTVIAIQSRNEAQRQRAEAEGLVEFMLTDLREELRGVGRLDLMAGVSERALEYYGAQCDFDRLEADSLQRCASGLIAVGEVEGSAGDWRGAQAKFDLVHRATEKSLGQEPDDPDRIFAHAQSEYWVGYAHWQQLDVVQAERSWRGYLALAERLAAADPGSVRSLMELGYANGNMCEVLRRSAASMGTAFEHCRDAIRFMRQAVDREPGNAGNVMALANRHGWLADALLRSGDFDQALGERRIEKGLLDGLAARVPADTNVRKRQAWALIGMGEIELRRGRFDASLAALDKARSDLEAMARRDPDNQDIAAFLMRTLMLTARAGRGAGRAGWQSYEARARQIYAEARAGKDGEPVRKMGNLLEL